MLCVCVYGYQWLGLSTSVSNLELALQGFEDEKESLVVHMNETYEVSVYLSVCLSVCLSVSLSLSPPSPQEKKKEKVRECVLVLVYACYGAVNVLLRCLCC